MSWVDELMARHAPLCDSVQHQRSIVGFTGRPFRGHEAQTIVGVIHEEWVIHRMIVPAADNLVVESVMFNASEQIVDSPVPAWVFRDGFMRTERLLPGMQVRVKLRRVTQAPMLRLLIRIGRNGVRSSLADFRSRAAHTTARKRRPMVSFDLTLIRRPSPRSEIVL